LGVWGGLGIPAPDGYNAGMQSPHYLPEANRTSAVTVTILLAYALTHILSAPVYTVYLPIGGIQLNFDVNLNTVISLIASGMAAAGMYWILKTHPRLQKEQAISNIEHIILPTLTALIIGTALTTLPGGALWWLGFGVAAGLMVLIFMAEYVAVDPTDTRYPLAMAGLTAISFTLYLILATALRAGDVRLFIVVPALFIASGLSALRNLHLRLSGRWEFGWAGGIALISAQIGAALHYWPLTPLQFGLALLGPAYALTILASILVEGEDIRRAVAEPVVMLVILWGLAIWFH
jgi:hypothetical protein